ncbi:hypothetical protein GWI33_007727 [Rhynchophorus ferrugineus]|uniref:Inositol-1-monophosphatase n=1 Tax=Rhynchophorus ferrugineus TaxID=354439 RepID=A0A834MEN2_RHYFE|nr:hypothetical protein GWI33_007727 [Rhynchophorus ferrugineus]
MAFSFQECMDFVLPVVLKLGENLAKTDLKTMEIETKSSITDLVTVHDRNIEDALKGKLIEKYPTHRFIGEEDSSIKRHVSELTDLPTWIIDPIDGTTNFVKGMPIIGISVALVVDKEPELGIIYNPYANELFTAIRGNGAYFNEKRITTSGVTDIQRSVLNMELSFVTSKRFRNLYLTRFAHFAHKTTGVRSYGSAAMGLCYLACGRIDAYQADGLCSWDVAAGVLIVQEAGGYVVDSKGGELDLMKPNILATATKELGTQYLEEIRQADEKL